MDAKEPIHESNRFDERTEKDIQSAEFRIEGPSRIERWCPEAESNHRHEDFQSSALPTELSGQYCLNAAHIKQ